MSQQPSSIFLTNVRGGVSLDLFWVLHGIASQFRPSDEAASGLTPRLACNEAVRLAE